MKVLLGHNFYLQPGGEDAVFRNERQLLEEHGIEVVPFVRRNDALASGNAVDKLRIAFSAAWSQESARDLGAVIARERPDIAHFHNTFPMLTASVYQACADAGVPVVQTLHNYRTICPSATLFRDGAPCHDCVGRMPWRAVRHRCYRGSIAGSAAVAWMLARHRALRIHDGLVDRYVALTRFAANVLAQGGLPASRIEVKPNFMADAGPPGGGGGGYALFVGRLSQEKGVRVLLDAWSDDPGIALKVAGDGPLLDEMRATVARGSLRVELLGRQDEEAVRTLIGNAECLLVPSLWYEGFPMVIVEAYACGTPVVASAIGSLDELVAEGETGMKFPAGDARALRDAVETLHGSGQRRHRMREQARARFEACYVPERNFETLIGIYERAAEERRMAVAS